MASLGYPVTFNNGSSTILTGRDSINASIAQVLGAKIGENPANPYLGSNLHRLLFIPNDEVAKSAGIIYIKDALAKWETRIKVTTVTAEVVNDDFAGILFNISYVFVENNTINSFQFPFYRTIKF